MMDNEVFIYMSFSLKIIQKRYIKIKIVITNKIEEIPDPALSKIPNAIPEL